MRIRPFLITLAACLVAAPSASAADFVPGELIVKREGAAAKRVEIGDGDAVREKAAEVAKKPGVEYAKPNYIARVSFRPNDPGWNLQWNFRDGLGIEMPTAWDIARRRGAPGGRGATVAVLDTGVAYRRTRRYRRAPDLGRRFVRGYDFVSRDRYPDDQNGHGTHIAGTIAESTSNRRAAAGVAYRARIMPVRVLDSEGEGNVATIAKALRWAARRRPDVINLSLEFGSGRPLLRRARRDRRAALRAPPRRGRGRRVGQLGRGALGLASRARPGRDRRGRHHPPRLPGRVLQRRPRPRHRRPRRRRGRRPGLSPGRPLRPSRLPSPTRAGAGSTSRPSPPACGASACRAATRAPPWPPPT